MKKQSLLLKAILIPVFLIAFVTVWAQWPTYQNRVMNDYLVDAFTYEFDVYLLHDGGAPTFELASYQMGLFFDPAIINGGTVSCQILAGTCTFTNPAQHPTTVSIATGPSGKYCMLGVPYGIIRLAGKTPPGTGNGSIISTVAPGDRVSRFRLVNTVAFGQAEPLKCFNFEATPYNTVVRAYVGGSNTNITTQAFHFLTDITNPILNKPLVGYNVTGTGNYCQGGTGLPVGLDGSELKVDYTLSGGGATLPGTGGLLSWGDQLAGIYTVTAVRKATYITGPMLGSAVITEITVPNAAGPIAGPATVTQGDIGVAYSVGPIPGADSYNWSTTGTDWTINGNTQNITVDFGAASTSGTLSVKGHNVCGDGGQSDLPITVNPGGGPVTRTFGDIDNNWFNPLNWTPNGVPGPADDVIIPGGLTHYPIVTAPATCHTMYLADGATILGNGFITFTGKAPATVERNINGNWTTPCYPNWSTPLTPATEIHFLSSPVTGAPWNTFEKDALFRWDEPLQIWTGNHSPASVSYWWDCTDPYPHTNAIPVGLGLQVAINQDWFAGSPVYACLPIALCEAPTAPAFRRYFNGTLNSGDYNINLSYTGSALPFVGWNLIGNPYPSAVDWNLVTKVGPIFPNSASIWNPLLPGYVNVVGAGIDIPYTQSLFVQVFGGASFVTFNEASRKIGTLPLKANRDNFLTLNVNNLQTGKYDETYVTFNTTASPEVDQLDGRKLQNGAGVPMLYSRLADDTHLAYNTLQSMDGNPVVFVDFMAGTDGIYTITAKELESFTNGYSIYLEDLALGTVQNLMEDNTYTFNAATGDDPARFKLFFGAVGMEELGNGKVTIYSSNKDVFISYTGTDDATATIYNNLGQPVTTQVITPGKTHKISLNTPSGYYIVKMVNHDDVVAQKVFIR